MVLTHKEILYVERSKNELDLAKSIFTYKKLPQANLGTAKESLVNAEKFFRNINLIVRRRNSS